MRRDNSAINLSEEFSQTEAPQDSLEALSSPQVVVSQQSETALTRKKLLMGAARGFIGLNGLGTGLLAGTTAIANVSAYKNQSQSQWRVVNTGKAFPLNFDSKSLEGWSVNTKSGQVGNVGFCDSSKGENYLTTARTRQKDSYKWRGQVISGEFDASYPFMNVEICIPSSSQDCRFDVQALNGVGSWDTIRSVANTTPGRFTSYCLDLHPYKNKKVRICLTDNSPTVEGFVGLRSLELSERPNTVAQAELEKFVMGLRQKYELPSFFMGVQREGQVIALVSAGYRNNSFKNVVSVDDPLLIGSTSKVFNSTLMWKLIQDGLLKPQTRVKDVLPELCENSDEVLANATVLQMMNHTSGLVRDVQEIKIGNYDQEKAKNPQLSLKHWRYRVAQIALQQPAVPNVGTCSYSNENPLVLAAMAEKITGKTYEQLIEDLYKNTYGLSSLNLSGDYVTGPKDTEHIWGHILEQSGDVTPIFKKGLGQGAPSGGFSCSTLDLLQFGSLHLGSSYRNAQPISRETFRQMHSFTRDAQISNGGWMPIGDCWLEHTGDISGRSVNCVIDTKHNTGMTYAISIFSSDGKIRDNIHEECLDEWSELTGMPRRPWIH